MAISLYKLDGILLLFPKPTVAGNALLEEFSGMKRAAEAQED